MTKARTLANFIGSDSDVKFDTDTLYVDSSEDRVGINTSNPVYAFHTRSTSGAVGILESTTGASTLYLKNSGTTYDYSVGISSSSNDLRVLTGDGSEAMRIDSSQRVLIGYDTSKAIGSTAAGILQIHDSTAFSTIARYTAGTGGPLLILGKAKTNTIGGNTLVANGDTLGDIRFAGADGTDVQSPAADIIAQVDGTPGANDMPGRLTFWTTPDGTTGATERMRITNAGNVGINDQNPGVKLSILNGSDAELAVQIWGADNTSEYLGLGQNGGDSVLTAGSTGGNNTDLVIRTADGGTEINRVRISGATGNVQIDTDQSIDTATNMPLQIARNGGTLIKQSADYSGSVNGLYWLLTAPGSNRYTGGIYGNTTVSGGEAQNAHIRIYNQQATPTSSDSPGYITFSTTPDGTASASERMRIHSNGVISIGQGFTPIGALGILQTNTNDDNGNSGLQVRTDTSGTRYGGFGVYDDVGGKEGLAIAAGSATLASSDIYFRTAASGTETERMRITRDGMVLINSDDAVSVTAGATPVFQVQGASFAYSTISTTAFRSATASGPTVSLLRSRSATVGSGRAIVQDGDELGKIRFYGADGVDFDNYGANIAAKVNGTPGADDMPGALVFGTTADGGVSSTDRMQINSAGRVSMSGNAGDITVKGDAVLTLSDNIGGNDGARIAFHYDGNSGYAFIGTRNTNTLVLSSDPTAVGNGEIKFEIETTEVAKITNTGILRASNEFWITETTSADTGLRIRPRVANNLYGFSDAGTTYNIGLINEEGTANQAIIIGDVNATNNTLFGVSVGTGANPTTGSEGTWNAKLSLKGNGSLNLPNQPASRVRWTITDGVQLQTIIGGSGPSGTLFRYGWDILPSDTDVTFSEQWDNGGNVDTNGRFTAPSSGTYVAHFWFYHEEPDGTEEKINACISINGSKTEELLFEAEQNPAYTIPRIQGFSGAFGLNSGDTLAPGFVPTAGGLNFEVPKMIFSVYKVT